MLKHVVILREAEVLGTVKLAEGFDTKESAKDFAKKLVETYTTDEIQVKFIEEQVGDPVEFVSDSGQHWQIEICKVNFS